MKIFLLSLFVMFGILGQTDAQVKRGLKIDEDFLVHIAEAKGIYFMSEMNEWTCVVGNRALNQQPVKEFSDLISENQNQDVYFDSEVDFGKKMKKEGNLFIAFTGNAGGNRYFMMNQYKATMWSWLETGKRIDHYPKQSRISDDLINLCKLKWLVTKLSKGELDTNDYRLSVKEWTLLMRLCPDHWADHLVKYAVSDNYSGLYLAENDYLKILIDSQNLDEKFLEKYPYLVEVDTQKKFYGALVNNHRGYMDSSLTERYQSVIQKLEGFTKLNTRDRILVKIILGSEEFNKMKFNSYSELNNLRKYIIRKNDLELLKVYMKRVERRQSVADIPILGEFLQSDLYIKGSAKFRHAILDQCALRKEKEIVWLLADSMMFPEPIEDRLRIETLAQVAKQRAKSIMLNFTKKDLGDDPKAWKKWYRDQ